MTHHVRPSAGYAISLRVRADGATSDVLAPVCAALEAAGGVVDRFDDHHVVVKAGDVDHQHALVDAAGAVPGVASVEWSDVVFDLHRGGKIAVAPKLDVRTSDDLAQAYTPGVGRVSRAIAERPELVRDYTIKANSVAVLTNGTAVLGLGDIGPEAALPVMEGKALLFKALAGIDAYPLCVRAHDAESIAAIGAAVEPGFGGINLEDVSAPVCFEAERLLRDRVSIPVFHDDQHGTAVVTLAALLNAARVVGKDRGDLRIVFLGLGAAGIACIRLLLRAGVGDVIGVDRAGVLHRGRTEHLNDEKREIAQVTNRDGVTGTVADALRGADVFVGVSGPDLLQPAWVETMARDAIVFAMANPDPEIRPELVPANVAVMATGRSDYPNQINNALVFPGFFRGLLDAGARRVEIDMKLAAAHALAELVGDDDLGPEHIVPSVFDPRVVPAVAGAVEGIART